MVSKDWDENHNVIQITKFFQCHRFYGLVIQSRLSTVGRTSSTGGITTSITQH